MNGLRLSRKSRQPCLCVISRFSGSKPVSVPIDNWKKWNGMRHRLPNLHLLEGRNNSSKNDMHLVDYYNDMNNEQKVGFYKQAMISEEVSLEIEDFEKFYEVRKIILTERIRKLLG